MQTKKRAKPVKFGKAAREAEEKKAEKIESPAEEEVAVVPAAEHTQHEPEPSVAAESHAQPEAPTTQHGGELVDKLSDVPFETDFGSPSSPATPANPVAHQTSAPEPDASVTAAAAEEHQVQEEQSKPAEFDQVAAPQIDVTPVQPNSPLGRANEPIPFNPHETVFSTPPDGTEKKKNPFLFFIIVAFVAFVTGIAFMAGIYYAMPDKNLFAIPGLPGMTGQSITNPVATQTPSTVAQATPTVAPSKAATIADYDVSVKNGSGVSGQAAKVKALLEADGFSVGTVGNADTSNYTKTEITVKKSVDKAAVTKLTDILKKTYVLNSKITELPTTATAEPDITVIIGKETVQ